MKNLQYPRNLRKAFSSLDHLKRNSMAISLDDINRNKRTRQSSYIPRRIAKDITSTKDMVFDPKEDCRKSSISIRQEGDFFHRRPSKGFLSLEEF